MYIVKSLCVYTYIHIYIHTYMCSVTKSCPAVCNPQTIVHQAQTLSVEFLRQEYRSGLPFPSPIYSHTHIYKRLKGNFTDLHFWGVIFVPVFQFCIINMYNFYFFNVTFKITEMSNCYLSLKGFSFGWVTTGTSQLSLSPDPFPLDSQRSLYCLQGCLLCLQADQFNILGPIQALATCCL